MTDSHEEDGLLKNVRCAAKLQVAGIKRVIEIAGDDAPLRGVVCLQCRNEHVVHRHCKLVCENCGYTEDCSDL